VRNREKDDALKASMKVRDFAEPQATTTTTKRAAPLLLPRNPTRSGTRCDLIATA
jgi:hypothetical protein